MATPDYLEQVLGEAAFFFHHRQDAIVQTIKQSRDTDEGGWPYLLCHSEIRFEHPQKRLLTEILWKQLNIATIEPGFTGGH